MTNSRRNDEPATDDLVVRAKDDREAFGTLYDRLFPVIHRYCQRRLLNRAAADDVSSEVFLLVARAIRRFPGSTEEDFRRWVYRIATNTINAHLRQQSRRGELLRRAVTLGWWSKEESSAEPCASTAGDGLPDQGAAVVAALAQLSPREQSVITLRFMEGMTYEEVAEVLGMRAATLRVVASRAIKALRSRLLPGVGAPLTHDRERPAP